MVFMCIIDSKPSPMRIVKQKKLRLMFFKSVKENINGVRDKIENHISIVLSNIYSELFPQLKH